LRNRINSVKATQKITKAMQMVAAAKLRRAQEAAEAARPYSVRMNAVIAKLAANLKDQEGVSPFLAGTGREDVHLLVVCTAERGLCGSFNSSIAKLAAVEIDRLRAAGRTVKLLCVGRKGYELLRRQYGELMIDAPVDLRQVRRVRFAHAHEIADRLIRMFDAGEFDVCTLFYAEFRSVISQKPKALQLIPARLEEMDEAAEAEATAPAGDGGAVYEYEPDETEILNDLLPRNVSVQVFRALLENAASEQGARMTAMDNATRNAGDMIRSLTLHYNRQRQAQITKELIEIISGAEAL
ncbi:MAG TPA: F0F1 ATP synthase subunit gamma, partial [Thermopetrobacter sp.]|nr:F0F1 ATP synthase subunit gamma [Thermopetrobacter sp.]